MGIVLHAMRLKKSVLKMMKRALFILALPFICLVGVAIGIAEMIAEDGKGVRLE